jgi:hypothetical protein
MQSKGRLQALMSFETAAEADAFRDKHILPRIAESWFAQQVQLLINHSVEASTVESCIVMCCVHAHD